MSEITDAIDDVFLDSIHSDVAEWTVPDFPKKLIVVKVGSDERPAGPEDIDNAKESIEKCLNDLGASGYTLLVTHHLFEMDILDLTDMCLQKAISQG